MNTLAVVILTYNEAIHLDRALASIASVASEVYVIDSGSTDATVDIAKARGATVLTHAFVNQAKQFQWAMDNTNIQAEWILRLDADEIIEPDLAQEIRERLPALEADVMGINLNRKHIFMGRWVRHGGRYPLHMLRIFRKGHGKVEDRWMDEHITVSGGRTVTFNGGFADHNLNDLSYFIDKHNRYATREAIEVLNQRHGLFDADKSLTAGSASAQAAFKRAIKEKIYNKLPFTVSSTLYFLWRYVGQLGFLDGRSGLVYHFLQGWWYRFLVGAKVMELQRATSHIHEPDDKVAELSRLTGLRLQARGGSNEA